MKIQDIITALETWAPRSLQEDYDNSGLQTGDPASGISSALVCLDCTEAVVDEAILHGHGLVICHHPLIFRGLKSMVAHSYVERTVLKAIKHDIAVYAIHTNLDNVLDGVNGEIAARLGLKPLQVLDPKPGQLRKLVVFVPRDHADAVRNALFNAGGGQVGAYDECSFNIDGVGTFRAGESADPYVGPHGQRHHEPEVRIEVIYQTQREAGLLRAMRSVHPYEEVAFDLIPLSNPIQGVGSGLLGEWERPLDEEAFLVRLKEVFGLSAIRHSPRIGRPVQRVALCGGSGAFLIRRAISLGADAYVTGDVKYHEFFDADGRLLLADIGHYGSEQFTMHLIQRRLRELFPTFAVHLTGTLTDPIHYF